MRKQAKVLHRRVRKTANATRHSIDNVHGAKTAGSQYSILYVHAALQFFCSSSFVSHLRSSPLQQLIHAANPLASVPQLTHVLHRWA